MDTAKTPTTGRVVDIHTTRQLNQLQIDLAQKERNDAKLRLMVTRSNFAAAIRQGQMAGLSERTIGIEIGLDASIVRHLIVAWGLDT